MKDCPVICPFCDGELLVEELACRQCDTHFQGRWSLSAQLDVDAEKMPTLTRLAQLSVEQLKLIESFILCEGKLNRLQQEIGLSYPTLRSRLNDIIKALGGQASGEAEDQHDRRQILDRLAAGEINAEEAAQMLQAVI